MSYTDLFTGYDDVEESHGFDGDPLPTDWYYLLVEKVLDVAQSNKGAITARIQVGVQEGPKANAKAFVSIVLAPAAEDKNGAQRNDVEMRKANSNIQAQMKGFLRALGVTTGQPLGNSLVDKAHSFYNVNAWEGSSFIAKVSRRENAQYGASNQLSSYYSLSDEKRGLDWYRNDHLAKSTPSTDQRI